MRLGKEYKGGYLRKQAKHYEIAVNDAILLPASSRFATPYSYSFVLRGSLTPTLF